ncbi:hypothetical protein EPUS_04589 [Endocarpon pusillum Z07020]|uniref:DUF974 domain protein n=1 Tax=Endocarpon pusillum (strain Z07020 / HMAS-L-300199) TaxID=1263415 RepID=U1I143_ENDPU|nr:uncharacterized protein EPUS_04589 [Endocarpon pusillum Z07020]ERF75609.1 hypothetical protein EPUS_04589 [Endocarpon pusillum Z07020]
MARSRARSSGEMPKEPHVVSLKVLRLSRPSLAEQHPLPLEDPRCTASLAYPSEHIDHVFALSPLLTLPPSFGSTYVGEMFACSLCANNELMPGETSRMVISIGISAEMQTPSQTIPLELETLTQQDEEKAFTPGSSIQKIVRFDLKEEGNHVLAVNITYMENTLAAEIGSAATGGRSRTFRKLYQFVAQPCLSVRTKATELSSHEIEDKTLGPYGKSKLLRFALEAQLENVADMAITLEQTSLDVRAPFKSTSMNCDGDLLIESSFKSMLSPRDVLQVAYLVEQQGEVTDGLDTLRSDMKRDGRTALGQLSIEWRGPMGERGFLTTGNLLTRRIVA